MRPCASPISVTAAEVHAYIICYLDQCSGPPNWCPCFCPGPRLICSPLQHLELPFSNSNFRMLLSCLKLPMASHNPQVLPGRLGGQTHDPYGLIPTSFSSLISYWYCLPYHPNTHTHTHTSHTSFILES